jgi:hypothetical protein
MASEEEVVLKPRQSSGSTFPVVFSFLAFSGAWWAAYAVPLRRKEWVDILLDYSHHKRTQFCPGLLDRSASFALRLLRIR